MIIILIICSRMIIKIYMFYLYDRKYFVVYKDGFWKVSIRMRVYNK